ncbi:hypothetical protein ACFWGP_05435 [Agromyces sp. NPDC127015]|uniref:hypothetical protein n=1 Tax=Agromyces sp. NPDC127015 TaxID=3347108 RepID=UPI003667C551
MQQTKGARRAARADHPARRRVFIVGIAGEHEQHDTRAAALAVVEFAHSIGQRVTMTSRLA